MTFTQLGDLLGCSRQNIKKLAAVLEQKGFVTIIQNENDKRASFLLPTERLGEYFEQTAALHGQKLACLFQGYTDQEMEQLFTLLMKLYDGIDGLEAAEEAMTGTVTVTGKEGYRRNDMDRIIIMAASTERRSVMRKNCPRRTGIPCRNCKEVSLSLPVKWSYTWEGSMPDRF